MVPTRSKPQLHTHSQSVHHLPSPQTPTHPIPHPRTRGRSGSLSLSLSIARSPNVLSSGTFFSPLDDDLENGIGIGTSTAQTQTNGNGNGYALRRVVSHHLHPRLDTIIQSVDDLPSLVKRTKDDMDIDFTKKDHTSTPFNHNHNHNQNKSIYTNDVDNEDKDDIQKPLLGVGVGVGIDIMSTQDGNQDPVEVYEGPFQPPDSKELLGIIASIFGVGLLAFAACMTTLYDWVL